MNHTTLFKNFPGKFHITKSDGEKYMIYSPDCSENIYSFLKNNNIYKDITEINVEDSDDTFIVIEFKYINENNYDYSETIEFDPEELKEKFSYIEEIEFYPPRLPYYEGDDCGNYYSIKVSKGTDCTEMKEYIFDRFGYFETKMKSINTKEIHRFRNNEPYSN